MSLFEWGEKRFARGIARAMIRSYKLYKKNDPSLNELGLIRQTLSDRPGEAAKNLLTEIEGNDFWENVAGGTFFGVIYLLVRLEYVEYMNGAIDNEDIKTNSVFKSIILEELEKEKL
jgi:hypothetical protein